MGNYIPKIFKKNTAEDYLNAAIDVAEWIDTLAIKTEYGRLWRKNPEGQDEYNADSEMFTDKSFYTGSAGIGFFFIRLYEMTGNKRWLTEAEEACRHIIATKVGADWYRKTLSGEIKGIIKVPGWAIGWSAGPAGEGYFAEELYRVTGKKEYRDYFLYVADVIMEASVEDEKGLHWSNQEDFVADGGLLTYLEFVYRQTGIKKYLDFAVKAARVIGDDYVDAPNGGKLWPLMDLSLIDFEKGTTFPNFAHGTTGIAWIFANLYEDTKDEYFLNLAKEGVKYVQNISVGDESGTLIPYQDHPVKGPTFEHYYLSECHGPVGSTYVFRQLEKVTGDFEYRAWAKKLSRGIVRAGAPEHNSWGYWNCQCLCCGAAGILEHFVNMYTYTGEEEFLNYAKRTADLILSKADDRVDGIKFWNDCWWRTHPNRIVSYTGLYIGSAGCGATLLSLYAVLKGKEIAKLCTYKFF